MKKKYTKVGMRQFFRKALAMQLHHERDQIVMTLRSNETQIRHCLCIVQHVSVRKHEPLGIQRACPLNALVHGPQFSCPPRRQGLALNHNKRIGLACFFCGAPCHVRGTVGTLVIYEEDGHSHTLI